MSVSLQGYVQTSALEELVSNHNAFIQAVIYAEKLP